MPNQVVQLKQIGNITFSKNRRSKNIKISVKPDKSVLVSFPFYVSSKEVLAFVLKNEDWIRSQQQKMELRKAKVAANSELKTKLHTIKFILGSENRIMKRGSDVTIIVTDFEEKECLDYIEHYVTEIYRIEAKRLLPVRISELAKRNGFDFNKITIRNNRRNWGSCSSQNNISLNLQMMKLPVELIDYILLHELVHTEIKNHGEKFWQRLNQITNNRARELATQVKQYSTYTL
ncbi:SprT family zinc-dependent metalloprotease [Prolixibacteraceae bacterium Z1-6]|uniref:SprT family zinc-dependent metalloprotease n=1 Tax=Draconibacterium aestuarii TaxID=2998507 RepID=A0A9X3J8X8_9BACT|nr:SprT family zinc-dependent metalloprotease [Prolixibacteraceae bacterium Z1-6]